MKLLTTPESLTTLTFCGNCCPSVRGMFALCITVLFAPGLGPWVTVWPGSTEGMRAMFFWVTWFNWVRAPGLFRFCTALFLRCCKCCCWFCCGWPHLAACCCWALPTAICRRDLTLGRGAVFWGLQLGRTGAAGYGPFSDWFKDCCVLWENCLCCWGGCFCSSCCCGCNGCWCCTGCVVCWFCCKGWFCEGAGLWLGGFVWELSLSSSSFFLTPACICRRISFLFRISSLRRFCSSIFRRYCRVSSSSSGFCGTHKQIIRLAVSTCWKWVYEPLCPI